MGERWDRILIVGCSGAGKSKLARRLSDRLDLRGEPLDLRKVETRLGGVVEVAYVWPDITMLVPPLFICPTSKEICS